MHGDHLRRNSNLRWWTLNLPAEPLPGPGPGSFPACVTPSVPDLVLACAHTVQVDQLNKDYTEKKISKTDLIQKKLNAVETHLG